MKLKKFMGIVSALILIVFSASGCSSANQADTDAVNAAIDKFRACESFSLVQLSENQETVVFEGENYAYLAYSEMEMDLISGEDAQMRTGAKAFVSFDSEQTEQITASYIVPENGGYAEYLYDGAEWTKFTVEQSDALAGLSADSVAATFFTENVAFGKSGEETVNGIKALRYDGRLGGENLVGMLDANGLLGSISSMSANQQESIRKNLVKDLDDIVISVWIDEASGYPVRVELNMGDMMKELNDSIAKSLGNKESETQLEASVYTISMSLSNFNAVEDLVLPAEAASARPYEAESSAG